MISKLHLNSKPDPARYRDPEQPERSWGDERDAKNFRFGEKIGVFFGVVGNRTQLNPFLNR